MPLKHHTETALLVLLGCIVALTGMALSVLPALPLGFSYWCVLFILALAYPLLLRRSFRVNRADYEFRLLHWLPALMVLMWLLFAFLDSWSHLFSILRLGLFSLWSLPLVFFSILLIILFCLSVLRRSRQRITALVVLLIAFLFMGATSHYKGWNASITQKLSTDASFMVFMKSQYHSLLSILERRISGPFASIEDSHPSSSSDTTTESGGNSASFLSSTLVPKHDDNPGIHSKPGHLAKSGPEIEIIFSLCLAAYCSVLHERAKKRISGRMVA